MIVLVGSDKGGTGKTTVATNLAVLCAARGQDVLLVDTDSNVSSTVWSSVREASERPNLPKITCMSKTGPSTGYDIAKLRDKFDTIIVDAGGRDSLELRAATMIADRMVIPVKPSQFDIWTLTPMEQMLYDARARGNEALRPLVCVNLASPNPSLREDREVREYLRECHQTLGVAQTTIHERVSFRRAAREGVAVCELAAGDNAKAAHEIQALYDEVFA